MDARITRALNQRMFYFDRPDQYTWKTIGSTGTLYTVKIGPETISCTCPDSRTRGQFICKHLIFVLFRVLKVDRNIQFVRELRKTLTPYEITQIYRNSPDVTLHRLPENTIVTQKPLEDCGICYEAISSDDDVTWCRSVCGNNVHSTCFDMWRKACRGSPLTCVFCRSRWS